MIILADIDKTVQRIKELAAEMREMLNIKDESENKMALIKYFHLELQEKIEEADAEAQEREDKPPQEVI